MGLNMASGNLSCPHIFSPGWQWAGLHRRHRSTHKKSCSPMQGQVKTSLFQTKLAYHNTMLPQYFWIDPPRRIHARPGGNRGSGHVLINVDTCEKCFLFSPWWPLSTLPCLHRPCSKSSTSPVNIYTGDLQLQHCCALEGFGSIFSVKKDQCHNVHAGIKWTKIAACRKAFETWACAQLV